MRYAIEGGPSFAHIHVDLEPGETLSAEAGAMTSMAADMDMKAVLRGGLFRALLRPFLGGESLFMNLFANHADGPRRVTLTSSTPGDMRAVELNDGAICLQAGAFIAATPGLKLGVQWAGLRFFLAREGLFKLRVSGTGTLFYGAFGGLIERPVNGELVVDGGHLVAFDPHLRLKLGLAGGLFSSVAGGEGLVLKIHGQGKVTLQTRTLQGVANWINPKLAVGRATGAGNVLGRMLGGG